MLRFCSLILVLIAFSKPVKSQQFQLDALRNDSVNFDIIHTSLVLLDGNKFIPDSFIVTVEYPHLKNFDPCKISLGKWQLILADSTTDWAANLALYHYFRKDAMLYAAFSVENRERWLLFKNRDTDYWVKFLKDHCWQ